MLSLGRGLHSMSSFYWNLCVYVLMYLDEVKITGNVVLQQ